MFKNRLRTAALAGAIAVATGISGLSVPAMAQTAENGYTAADGSALQNVTSQNITEAQLRDKTNATAAYLNALQNGSIEEIVDEYLKVTESEDGFDPSEEAAQIAFEAARTEATAQLATSAQNIQDARASVKFALEADQQAEADWDAFVAALQAAINELNPLIAATNAANTHVPTFVILPALPAVANDVNAVAVFNALVDLQNEVNVQWDLAGDWNIDETDGQYVNRTHMAALEALKTALDADMTTVTEAYETAKASNREAQKSDVLVRQLFLERATAQRDTLRVLEASFSVAARYVELYENDQLVGNTTLRAEYGSLIDNLFFGLNLNLSDLAAADLAAEEGFHIWETDLARNDDENEYFLAKLDFAIKTYAKIFLNGEIWQNELSRVQLLDGAIFDQIAQDKADREQAAADRVAAEQAAAEAKALEEARIKALEDIAKALEDKDETPAPAEKANGSSENAGLFGLIAAIGGIAALIAAAFPFISNFLR